MRFGSVCSGIEAASVAWPFWDAAWFSEIEPFPSAALNHHYPNVPNYGDMTTLPERILSGEVEAPDVFCGGTPCQAFSVAGNRKSLDDARGNLSLTFCEIADAIDTIRQQRNQSPAIIFWENVPGVLNTKDNAFGCFLAELAGEAVPLQPSGGRWTDAGFVSGPKRTIAWRVLDAQYFGLAQRRRRVFVVASAGTINPSEVLFEFDSLRRDTAPSRKQGQAAAGNVAESTRGQWWDGGQLAATLTKEGAGGNQRMPDKGNFGAVIVTPPHVFKVRGGCEGGGKGYLGQDEQAFTVACGQDQFVATPTYAIQGSMIGRNDNAGPQGDGVNVEISFTQNCTDRHAVAQPICFEPRSPDGHARVIGDISPTLNTMGGDQREPCVAQPVAFHPTQDPISSTDGSTHAMGCGSSGGQASIAVATNMIVRRLTPVECERLQGFPDNYTNILWRNKPEAPDGPRYKALGNSWAVPVVRWIGERINNAVNRL